MGIDSSLSHRVATADDIPALAPFVEAAIDESQTRFLTDEQILASHATHERRRRPVHAHGEAFGRGWARHSVSSR